MVRWNSGFGLTWASFLCLGFTGGEGRGVGFNGVSGVGDWVDFAPWFFKPDMLWACFFLGGMMGGVQMHYWSIRSHMWPRNARERARFCCFSEVEPGDNVTVTLVTRNSQAICEGTARWNFVKTSASYPADWKESIGIFSWFYRFWGAAIVWKVNNYKYTYISGTARGIRQKKIHKDLH